MFNLIKTAAVQKAVGIATLCSWMGFDVHTGILIGSKIDFEVGS